MLNYSYRVENRLDVPRKEDQVGEADILQVKQGILENGSHVHIMPQLWY